MLAHMSAVRWFVTEISTIVITVTVEQLEDAAAIETAEFVMMTSRPRFVGRQVRATSDRWVLIRPIF